jgi:hypothetical protein
MRVSEILAEGRDAPLFHGTKLESAIKIVADNCIYTGCDWRGEGSRVALTRSYPIARKFASAEGVCGSLGAVVFVMDQRKLAQVLKIKPHRDTDASGEYWPDEQEEMVMGDINPAESYILSINVKPEQIEFALSDAALDEKECLVDEGMFDSVDQIDELLHNISTHPKLNRWAPRGY